MGLLLFHQPYSQVNPVSVRVWVWVRVSVRFRVRVRVRTRVRVRVRVSHHSSGRVRKGAASMPSIECDSMLLQGWCRWCGWWCG